MGCSVSSFLMSSLASQHNQRSTLMRIFPNNLDDIFLAFYSETSWSSHQLLIVDFVVLLHLKRWLVKRKMLNYWRMEYGNKNFFLFWAWQVITTIHKSLTKKLKHALDFCSEISWRCCQFDHAKTPNIKQLGFSSKLSVSCSSCNQSLPNCIYVKPNYEVDILICFSTVLWLIYGENILQWVYIISTCL
jgi:hypothetical protein